MDKFTVPEDFGQQVKRLFDRCADLSPDEQARYLDDPDVPKAVRERVRSLLSHHDDHAGQLTDAIVRTAQQGLGLEALKPGDSIELYDLIKPIGQGGQGEVWLAERNDGEFSHQVAIKFLKPAHNERDLARFQSERALLASLHHPNIAQLIGGGQHHDGRLYMVLEWIDGSPIMDFLSEQQTRLIQRLELFRQICHAVSFAHSNGIIHRDIKPSNILVTAEGTVKLLDFGIAKPVGAEATETLGGTMMTLAYASPEQINGESASTSSDIYALGLVLYEMLTGQRAQQATTDSVGELLQHIITTNPVNPSQVDRASSDRQLVPSRRLQGDLDNLVMMAIRKEPERRYRHVENLIEDINNYLRNRPLRASGDSVFYRTGKLLRRNPLASTLGFLVLGFLIGLPVLMYQAQTQIAHQRDAAEAEALRANQTRDFLVTLFESATPLGSQGREVSLQDVLAQGERQVNLGLENQPLLKASMLDIFASIQHNLGNTEKAVDYYRQSILLYANAGDTEGELGARGQLAIMHYLMNDRDSAIAEMSAADTLASRVSDDEARMWHVIRQITLAHEFDEHERGIELGESALAEAKRLGIDNPHLMGRLYNELALSHRDSGDDTQARLLNEAIRYAELAKGRFHPTYVGRLMNKAVMKLRQEQYNEAQATLIEAREISEQLFPPNHPALARVVAEQGTLWHDKGEFELAEKAYLQVINITQALYGNTHSDFIIWTNNLAYLYEDMDRYADAEPLYRESVRLRRESGMSPRQIAGAEGNLARLLAKRGKYNESAALLEAVMPFYEENPGRLMYQHIVQLAALIDEGQNGDNCRAALERVQPMLPILEQQSATSWRRMRGELWLGDLMLRCDESSLGQQLLQAALDRSIQIYTPDSLGRQLITDRVATLLDSQDG